MNRNCICCEKEIKPCGFADIEDSFTMPPHDATVWTSVGNYGSRIFDPCGMSSVRVDTLEAFICDECLEAKARFIYRYTLENKTEREVKDLRVFDPAE